MTWQASYGDIEKRSNGRVVLYVDYTDGPTNIRREYDVTDKDMISVRQIIKDEIQILTNRSSLDSIKPGASVELPEEDSDRKAFLEDLNKLRKMNSAVQIGIMSPTHPDFLNQIQRVTSRFKSEYLNLL